MAKKKVIKEETIQKEIETNLGGESEKYITNEQRLELVVSTMERELVLKDIQVLNSKMESLDREKTILSLRLIDLQAAKRSKERSHSELVDSIGRRLGINLKGNSICPETGKITFH